jgi:plastocyanin
MKNGYILLAVTVVLLLVCGCTQSPTTVQPAATVSGTQQTAQQVTVTTIPALQTTASVSDNTIRIKNSAFDPASITVKAGSTVRWVNQDSVPHKLQFTDTSFSTQILGASQSESHMFVKPGVYDYICSIHPQMKGTVIVE